MDTQRYGSCVKWNRSLALALALFVACKILGADYEGATAIIKQIQEQSAKPAAGAKTDEHSRLREAIAEFTNKLSRLSPAEAATGWLELVDRRNKIGSTRHFAEDTVPVPAEELLAALPPPTCWNALAAAVTNRPAGDSEQLREIGLRLFTATLLNDREWRSREVRKIQEKARTVEGR